MNTPEFQFVPSNHPTEILAAVPLTCALSDKWEEKTLALKGNRDWAAWCEVACEAQGDMLDSHAKLERELRALQAQLGTNDSFPA